MWITPKKSDYMYIVVTSTIKIVEVDSYIIDCGNHAWVSTTYRFSKTSKFPTKSHILSPILWA